MKSKIIIANNIKLDKNYNNVIDYTEEKMLNLIVNNKIASADDYSFIRTNNNSISVSFKYNDCIKCNYLAFQNKDYSNKWFFAWIDDVIYKGDKTTEIIYTIDVWSTWFKTLILCECFVEREHTNNDSIGFNIVPEDINTGELIVEKYNKYDMGGTEYSPYSVVISSTMYLKGELKGSKNVLIQRYKGCYTPNLWYLIKNTNDLMIFSNNLNDIENFNDIFRDVTKGINSIFAIPSKIAEEITIDEDSKIMSSETQPYIDIFKLEKITEFSDYKPKNNKLLTSPFCYLRLTNLQGQYINLNYELFNNNIEFKIIGMLTENGCDIICIPQNYCNIENNYESSIPCGKYPSISWASDTFKQWITQNATNTLGSLITSGIGLLANQPFLTYSGVSGTLSNLTTSFINNANTPNNINGLNTSGDVLSTFRENTFHFYCMRPKTENLKIIDDYFSKYGYKTNLIKIPNISGRENFNYVKIGDKNSAVFGNIPMKYIDKINNILINGVTIWHNHNNIGNYDISNNII